MKKLFLSRQLHMIALDVVIALLSIGFSSLAVNSFQFVCTILITVLCVGLAAYQTYQYFLYKQKTADMVPQIGTVFNWYINGGRRAVWASVSVQINGIEYDSPRYFSKMTAQEMVGKQVSYVIYEGTLLIFSVLE